MLLGGNRTCCNFLYLCKLPLLVAERAGRASFEPALYAVQVKDMAAVTPRDAAPSVVWIPCRLSAACQTGCDRPVHAALACKDAGNPLTCGVCLILYAGLIPAVRAHVNRACMTRHGAADGEQQIRKHRQAACRSGMLVAKAHKLFRHMVQVSVEMFQLHMATAFHFFISNMAFGFACAGIPCLLISQAKHHLRCTIEGAAREQYTLPECNHVSRPCISIILSQARNEDREKGRGGGGMSCGTKLDLLLSSSLSRPASAQCLPCCAPYQQAAIGKASTASNYADTG